MIEQQTPIQATVVRWILIAFAVRLLLMLLIHISGADVSMRLTKDAFLYDRVGREIGEYYRSGGTTSWPTRVTGVVDFGWEHFIGIVYYIVGYNPIAIKFICVIAGTLVPLVHYRTAMIVTDDEKIGITVLVLSALFPTQVYYSALMVRDSVSALSVSLLFLGLAQYIRHTTFFWWVTFFTGFLILTVLRSYLASLLAVVIPISFLITALVAKGGRARAVSGMLALLIAVVGVTIFAPELVGELDLQYADIDYVNKVRNKMNSGSGAMFADGSVTEVGSGLMDTLSSFAVGLYFFFFSVNPTQIESIRQIMALPEVFLVVIGTYFSVKGGWTLWKERREIFLPLIIPTLVMTLGYSAATTNGGPLMRWRMQLLCVYLILAATGAITSYRAKHNIRFQPDQPQQISG